MSKEKNKSGHSPFTPAMMAGARNITDAQWIGDDLVFLERQSDQLRMLRWNGSNDLKEFNSGLPIRAGIFYGGGEFNCAQGAVFFVQKDGSVWKQDLDQNIPTCLTTAKGKSASPTPSPDGRWCLFVRSYNDVDTIELIDLQNLTGSSTTLVSGADFYMQPCWSPDSSRIAWIEWNQPQMPWQGTSLYLADFDASTKSISQSKLIDGSTIKPVLQPEFSPDGLWLSYLINQCEWDDLYAVNLQDGSKRILYAGKSLMTPAWVLGIRQYGWESDSQHLRGIESECGLHHLYRCSVNGREHSTTAIPEMTHLWQISIRERDGLVSLFGSGAKCPTQLFTWDGDHLGPVRSTQDHHIPVSFLPGVRSVSWQTASETIHGLHYEPVVAGNPAAKPCPTILHVHSGPTSQTSAGFSGDFAFYTSRGIAVLAINYRGSTGFGRNYLQALDSHWGEADVEDVVSAVDYLISNGMAKPDQIAIKGSSAGGYTVLNALIRYPGKFKAAVCAYPVGDLLTIVDDTFKYEARYYDTLIGPLPQDLRKYQDWSPLQFADRIQDPILLFHGEDDPVIPVSQTCKISEVLQTAGTIHKLITFPGEGHGWRKADTLEKYYQEIEEFLNKHLLHSVGANE